ncbi:CBS domain protein [Desulfosarcina variabilis str. Montpellier]|uniref:CBS domain-containing protein n=1 Tax=Desulfosarcina variabilis TaxID=2300 RepID=UPI003AFB3A22
MKTLNVKELMVPLNEYASVSEDATLADAIISLEKAQQSFDHTKYRHRAVLVLDQRQQVIGKISQIDALKALEPKYNDIQGEAPGSGFRHFSKYFLKSMQEQYRLFDKPLSRICEKAAKLKVKDFMQEMTEGEFLDADATLDEAIHMLIMGNHQSLLVTRDKQIIGILRLTDVFAAVFQSMTLTCAIK